MLGLHSPVHVILFTINGERERVRLRESRARMKAVVLGNHVKSINCKVLAQKVLITVD